MEGARADLRPAQRGRRGAPRAAPERGALVRRFHAFARGSADHQGAQPRAGQPCRRLAPQQVPVRDDRSGDHPGRRRQVGRALVGAVPQGRAGHEGGRLMRLFACAAAAASALFLNAGPAAAQVRPFASLDEMASYRGADRTQRLVEGAKKEGALGMYTSAQSDDMGALVAAFEKKYGIKVSMWRTSSEKVLQRAVTEAR